MIPVLIFAFLVVQITAALIWAQFRAVKLSRCTWNQLLAKIEPVAFEGVRIVAFASSGTQSGLSTEDLWDLLGGSTGLRRMSRNAKVMVALAGYMERQNNQEGMILANRMRQDGLKVRQTVRSMMIARYVRTSSDVLQAHLQETAKSYASMKNRLPALDAMCRGEFSGNYANAL